MQTILSLDIGYGDTKVVYGDEYGNIKKKFKFPTIIGVVSNKSDIVKDERVLVYDNNSYYVGENALSLESERIIDISNYKQLEYYSPLIVYFVCKLIEEHPSRVVTGLSKSQINNSGYFKEKLSKFTVNSQEVTFENVNVLPQGVPSKLTLEKYGINYPNKNLEFLDKSSYICVDIGFNTIDTFQTIDGEASANLAEGIEGWGVMKIADNIRLLVKEKFNKEITLKESKQILDTNIYRLRGTSHDLTNELLELKKRYLEDIQQLVETRYGKILDKMSGFYLIGGGSVYFKELNDNFIKIPNSENEFYNAFGFYLRYCRKE